MKYGEITRVTHLFSAIYRGPITPFTTIGSGPANLVCCFVPRFRRSNRHVQHSCPGKVAEFYAQHNTSWKSCSTARTGGKWQEIAPKFSQDAPWDWNILPTIWLKFMVHVGKYSSPMDPMAMTAMTTFWLMEVMGSMSQWCQWQTYDFTNKNIANTHAFPRISTRTWVAKKSQPPLKSQSFVAKQIGRSLIMSVHPTLVILQVLVLTMIWEAMKRQS